MFQKRWLKQVWIFTPQVLPSTRETRWVVKIQEQVERVTLHLKNGVFDQHRTESHPLPKQSDKYKALWKSLR